MTNETRFLVLTNERSEFFLKKKKSTCFRNSKKKKRNWEKGCVKFTKESVIKKKKTKIVSLKELQKLDTDKLDHPTWIDVRGGTEKQIETIGN